MRAARAGVTLIELIVVIAILGVIAGLTTVSLRAAGGTEAPALATRVAAARREAVRIGRAVELVVGGSEAPQVVRALPDGRVLADPSLGIDMATGRPRDAR
jgi:prepilin-type N-terminal cleavage/methylation domain-containing protein